MHNKGFHPASKLSERIWNYVDSENSSDSDSYRSVATRNKRLILVVIQGVIMKTAKNHHKSDFYEFKMSLRMYSSL